jgi:hypothetical protein
VQEADEPSAEVDANAGRKQLWEKDFFGMLAEEDQEDIALIYGMYSQYALHLDKFYNRAEHRVPKMSGLEWVEDKLANETSCYSLFRMSNTMFYSLHTLLANEYGLKDTAKSTSIEALGMFLWIVGAPQSARQAEDRFERSLDIVHTMFCWSVWLSLRMISLDLETQTSALRILGCLTLGSTLNSRTA